jgi:hypothetical protein
MGTILGSIAIFGVWWIWRNAISQMQPTTCFLLNLFGIGLPIAFILNFISDWLIPYIRIHIIENSTKHAFRKRIENIASSASNHNPLQDAQATAQASEVKSEPPPQYKTLLTSAQIEQLSDIRNKITIDEAKQFPMLRICGQEMINIVPGAGMFTAKINRHGECVNLVVMLASLTAITEFEKLCYAYNVLPQGFWAEGYLLPSRTGVCYSIFLVTAFRMCGRRLAF